MAVLLVLSLAAIFAERRNPSLKIDFSVALRVALVTNWVVHKLPIAGIFYDIPQLHHSDPKIRCAEVIGVQIFYYICGKFPQL